MKAKEFKLPYWISNSGDGSVSLRPTSTRQEADEADADMDEGWGEPCSGTLNLRVDEEGKLNFQKYEMLDGRYQQVWVEVKEE